MKKQDILNKLKSHLQTAIELEYSTLPPYLTAYWSIHGQSDNAHHAKKFFLSVIQEEMLHLSMACNILNAIGGEPQLNNPSLLPCYPCLLPGHSKTNHSFLVHLNKCCPQSIANFVQIELPEELSGSKHHRDGWCTIGEFYEEIEALLKNDLLKDDDFQFGKQLDSSFNPGKGNLFTVNSKQSALDALDEIIDQGEGHSGHLYDKDHELTHYWRFKAIGDLMENGLWNYREEVFDVSIDPDENFFTPEAIQLNKEFNLRFSQMLNALQTAFSSTTPSLDEAIRIMFLLKAPATQLMKIPRLDNKGNAGPTFTYLAG